MQTRSALQQIAGRSYELGDGPLSMVGRQLLVNFQARESDRLGRADEQAALMGEGPVLDVLRRKLAEARAQDMFQDATPLVTRWDAYQALQHARSVNPTDRGIKMAAKHVERLWHKDAMGVLTLGDVARLRAHYSREYPGSAVAEAIDREIPKVGFNTLPVPKLAQLAAQVTCDPQVAIAGVDAAIAEGRLDPSYRDRTIQAAIEDQRQYAYEQIVMANGLADDRPEHKRARAFIRELADMAAEAEAQPPPAPGGRHAAQRMLHRMAAYDDPILSRVGQFDPGMGPDDQPSPLEAEPPPDVEAEIPHEEVSEEITSFASPVTGDEVVLELGAAESEEEEAAMGAMPPTGPGEALPEAPGAAGVETPPFSPMGMAYFGQLDQYNEGDDELMLEEESADIPAIEDEPEEVVLDVADPTVSPDEPPQMLEITIKPKPEAPEAAVSGLGTSSPLPGMQSEAARRAAGRRVYSVWSISGGVRHAQPLERVRAPGMPAVLRRIAEGLKQAGAAAPREVRADPATFQERAFVVLDPGLGNYLMITADKANFEPSVPATGQPVVQHNLKIDKDDGLEVLEGDGEIKQNVPGAGSENATPTKKGRALSPAEVRQICAKLGLTANLIEDKVLAGVTVKAGDVRIKMNDEGDLELYRGSRGRVASLLHAPQVIGDFMALVAAQTRSTPKTAKSQRRVATYQIRPLFTVGCMRCGSVGEYLMPDRPENVRCASCDWITPLEAVAIQLESRQASAFPGYVVTATVPGSEKYLKSNARRMLSAIKNVVLTDGARVRQGQLEVTVRRAGDAELSRIRRVLEDVFGARDVTAQVESATPAVNALGQATQHTTAPMQPAAPPAPLPSPTAPPAGGLAGQQPAMQAHADPGGMPQVRPAMPQQPSQLMARRLPVGPGLKHVHVQYPDGMQTWIPVEAASEHMARSIIASYMDGTQVLQVVDSRTRVAQLEAPPPAGPEGMPGGPDAGGAPAESLGMEMTGPAGAPLGHTIDVANARIDENVENVIRFGLQGYRNNKLGMATAIDKFLSSDAGQEVLDNFGSQTNPARHLVEAAIVRIAKEIWEKPAMTDPTMLGAVTAAEKGKGGGPTPKKINTQQDDWVDLPGGGKVLGPDSTSGEGYATPKINQQVDTVKRQPGAKAPPTDMGPSSTSRDPGRFKAPKPPGDGHVFTEPSRGWGTSYADPDFEEDDSQTGDNETTSSMEGVSSGAYSNVRSK